MPPAPLAVEAGEPTITQRVADLLARWGASKLAREVRVQFSPRLSRSLGLSYPARGLVRLHPTLLRQDSELLDAALCHELAHVVVYRRYGTTVRPHGPEWRALVEAAGFEPRIRLTAASGGPGQPARRYRHVCPVCQSSRIAGRPMRRWRCGACAAQGLDGELQIERVS